MVLVCGMGWCVNVILVCLSCRFVFSVIVVVWYSDVLVVGVGSVGLVVVECFFMDLSCVVIVFEVGFGLVDLGLLV